MKLHRLPRVLKFGYSIVKRYCYTKLLSCRLLPILVPSYTLESFIKDIRTKSGKIDPSPRVHTTL